MRRLLAHLAGDYVLGQNDYLAGAKVQRTREGARAAAIHAAAYTACFVPFTRNPARLAVIGVTHALLDHYRPLAYFISWKDRVFSPAAWPYTRPHEVPFWLVILVDNSIHLAINELALDVQLPKRMRARA